MGERDTQRLVRSRYYNTPTQSHKIITLIYILYTWIIGDLYFIREPCNSQKWSNYIFFFTIKLHGPIHNSDWIGDFQTRPCAHTQYYINIGKCWNIILGKKYCNFLFTDLRTAANVFGNLLSSEIIYIYYHDISIYKYKVWLICGI